MQLYIEGRIRTRSWEDQNGIKRYTTEIYADTMQMLSRKSDRPAEENKAEQYTPPVVEEDSPDDLPF